MKKYLAKGMKGMFKAAQNTVKYATGKQSSTTAVKAPLNADGNADEEEKK